MNNNIFSLRRNGLAVLLLPLLLAGGLLGGGCSSDPVAPHDEAPALTAEGAANQAGLVAMAVTVVGPQVLDFAGKSDKTSYTYVFPEGGSVAGTVHLDYFTGGPTGTPADWNNADYVNLFTAEGEWLTIDLGLGGGASLGFDVGAQLDRNAGTAVVTGGGTFASGPYAGSFTFDDVGISAAASYPTGGSLVFTGSGFSATVTFSGGSIATAVVTGGSGGTYLVNLATGAVTPAT